MYQYPTTRRSFLNIIMDSNKIYSTPQSSSKDRRFLVLNADCKAYLSSEALRQELRGKNYFEYLRSSIEDEKVQKTFFHFLYRLPLNGFNPQVIPMTLIGARSAIRRMSPHQRWWNDCILSAKNTTGGIWKKEVTATELFHCFLTFKYEKSYHFSPEQIERMAYDKSEMQLFLGEADNIWPLGTKKTVLRNTPGEIEFSFPDYLVCKADWDNKFRGFGLLIDDEKNSPVEIRRTLFMNSVTVTKLFTHFLPKQTGTFRARKEFLSYLLKKINGELGPLERDFLAHQFTRYEIRHGYELIQSEPPPIENIGVNRWTANVISNALRES